VKWSNIESKKIISYYKAQGVDRDIALRVYTARLLGSDASLVLHGGGNSSVKTMHKDSLGRSVEAIHVKGSGWDMGNIEPEGFPTLDLKFLRETQSLKNLSDEDMVAIMRRSCFNPDSPDPSVETLLHAFLPHKFVDHTHSNSVLVLANMPNGFDVCKNLYGDRVAVLPWIMPGFQLAKACSDAYEENPDIIGIVLLNHGIFSFGETAKESYERMIHLVQKAETKINVKKIKRRSKQSTIDIQALGALMIRTELKKSKISNKIPLVRYVDYDLALDFIEKKNNKELKGYGVITPDHVIRIKSKWLFADSIDQKSTKLWSKKFSNLLKRYQQNYSSYFNKNNKGKLRILDAFPRLVFIENIGLYVLGFNEKELRINEDLARTNISTQLLAINSGGFKPLSEKAIFEMEYWSLEQRKLGNKTPLGMSGKVVLVTGGAGAIGLETALAFRNHGAEVVLIDIDKKALDKIEESYQIKGYECNLTKKDQVSKTLNKVLISYGAIHTLVLNSGTAIEGALDSIDDLKIKDSLDNNFWAHKNIASQTIKIMKDQKIAGSLLFTITKQVFNQGKNFGAYGISKSAMLALMRQYAIECGQYGIRSNGVNPDKIRSNLLNSSMIKKRSKSRNLSESMYMRGNLLSREVEARDVANAFVYLATAESTTGAIITVDGGNAPSFVR
jgi:rhamnose utilization protein RhaD (predicted bifunctional aldolase and dehydrogenase)/NAD(P)-dependent dehydrogenase (short-subunit alcohol dehydrogenase family)